MAAISSSTRICASMNMKRLHILVGETTESNGPLPWPQACQAFALVVALGFAVRRLTSRCSALVAVDL